MLELKNIHKRFANKVALNDLSLVVNDGEILSLIGQNGAGKSTTFRIILYFIQADKGNVLWDGKVMGKKERSQIGFMPEERGLYQKETIINQMIYFADLHGMEHIELRTKLKDWMKRLNVVGKSTDRVESLSKGNAQKVQLIATMLFEPKLLILDEPFSGLDPVNATLLVNEILKAKENGAMIILSSHNMDNVERLSDKVVMLKHGNTVLEGTPLEIIHRFERTKLRVDGLVDLEILKKFNGVSNIKCDSRGVYHAELQNEGIGKSMFKRICQNQGYIPVFDQSYPSLDEIFKIKVDES
ncbi:MAG: ATP-binding cassette domain-containing protein [Liquorilactobacillus hordei]|uniref:ABC transporter ATP-binding protein n=1 Tax=Liquorilactobacillus hordei TaxID=468911 RepID=UPI0039EAAD9C